MLAKDIRAGKCYRMKHNATIIIFQVSSFVMQEHLVKVFISKSITCTQKAFTKGYKDIVYFRHEKNLEPFSIEVLDNAIEKFNEIHKMVSDQASA